LNLTIDTGLKQMVMVFDFDGTISEEDVLNALFDEYAGPQWREHCRAYLDDELTLKEAYLQMSASFWGNLSDIQAFLRRKARLRPGFKELLTQLREHHIPVKVVSNGFDIYLIYLLDHWKIDRTGMEIRCHHAEIISNRFVPRFYEHRNLRHDRCIVGKAEFLEELKEAGNFVAFAGNGYSDTPASHVADLLFAREGLADYCQKHKIAFVPFTDFHDISAHLFGK
jgi:2-hydroxy-3-keto-5-methylthiopentenyl-1-phosphate phosphatase